MFVYFSCCCPQIRFREVAPKLVQLLTEWTETFPYDFRDERMMRCLKDMTHQVARADEVKISKIYHIFCKDTPAKLRL